jgi:TatD DNase family protein
MTSHAFPERESLSDQSFDLVDIGVNLTHKQFEKDREEALDRALDAGVSQMVLTGCSVKGSRAAQAFAKRHPGICFSTAGVHPHDAKSCTDDTLRILQELADTPQVVAIGECGLDYNRDFSPRDTQRYWYEAQLALAKELNMPVFLHERDAADDFFDILSRYRDDLPAVVVHCFTGTEQTLRAYLELDAHIGITGWICDERRGGHLRDLVPLIPANRLMIETDAPFLLPRTIRPKPRERRNEPAYLTYVLETVAECMDKPVEQVALETTQTARAFFSLPTPE